MMHLIDSHCHLDFDVFDHDRKEILSRCEAEGIQHIIVPGVTAKQWPTLIKTCAQYPMLKLALGLHPMFMAEHQASHIDELRSALITHQAIAVGEIGLDFFIADADKNAQTELFKAQLKLAAEFNLPVILHVRKAHDEVLKLLREIKVPGGIVHAFNGSLQQAEHYQKLGFLFGAGGALTYSRANKLKTLFSQLPEEHIVLETDAPDMPLSGYQGQRNTPERLPMILSMLAELRMVSEQSLAAATTANCQKLFHFV
ncbi:TatD family hydrolase [Methylophaga sulfidovorans]|uniref:TatD DNase family protein n=1 Tax=Methylophaga sulfidovorans TaxID=45496 RepID=A0A1I3UZT9_9GAMM|nr:TatD family hydrolase [Methylophaga sulfidovorans]SFJ88954.1 TatD DNase family protein [Methylophaga sulfidovorans]